MLGLVDKQGITGFETATSSWFFVCWGFFSWRNWFTGNLSLTNRIRPLHYLRGQDSRNWLSFRVSDLDYDRVRRSSSKVEDDSLAYWFRVYLCAFDCALSIVWVEDVVVNLRYWVNVATNCDAEGVTNVTILRHNFNRASFRRCVSCKSQLALWVDFRLIDIGEFDGNFVDCILFPAERFDFSKQARWS